MNAPKDWYNEITNNIITMLESGLIPWRKTWQTGGMISLQSGKPYSGINALQLGMSAITHDYTSPFWVTFNEAKKRGGTIRKGEHGTAVFKWVAVTKEADNGEKEVAFMRMVYAANVFNLDQTDGVDVGDMSGIAPKILDPIAEADAVYANMPHRPALSHGGDTACYIPSMDKINMPILGSFESAEAYYSVLFHEMGHGTGHVSRLARKEVIMVNNFGSHDYSVEELVAEFTAAFLCGKVGIAQADLMTNSAAYIQGWSSRLKKDKNLIVTAAQRAQKAVDYILGQSEVATI